MNAVPTTGIKHRFDSDRADERDRDDDTRAHREPQF
jgi:hypothetical protein